MEFTLLSQEGNSVCSVCTSTLQTVSEYLQPKISFPVFSHPKLCLCVDKRKERRDKATF